MADQRTVRTDSDHSDGMTNSAPAEVGQSRVKSPALWLVGLGLLPFLASLVFATTNPEAPPLTITKPQPSLQFFPYLDFHDVRSRDLVPQLVSEFQFRNTGKETVQIGQLQRSCGCMSPEISTTTVAPGETGVLTVPIATARQSPGEHEYMLTVNYTDPAPQQAHLFVKATFPDQMVVLRPRLMILSQKSAKPIRHSFAIDDFRPDPLKIIRAESGTSFVTAKVGNGATLPDGGATLEVDVEIAASFPRGTHRFPVAALTNDDKFSVLTMPVFVQGPDRPENQQVAFRPETAVLVANSGEKRTEVVIVDMPADWKVSHLETWPPELDARYDVQAIADRSQLVVTIELSATPEDHYTEGVVAIHANESRDLVTIPVMLQWP